MGFERANSGKGNIVLLMVVYVISFTNGNVRAFHTRGTIPRFEPQVPQVVFIIIGATLPFLLPQNLFHCKVTGTTTEVSHNVLSLCLFIRFNSFNQPALTWT